MIDLRICGRSEVPKHLALASHVISIHSTDSCEPLPTFPQPKDAVLRLSFDDPGQGYPREVSTLGSSAIPPSREDISRAITFARTLPPDAKLLIHRHAGVSRSCAIALAVLTATTDLSPEAALHHIGQLRCQAWPNDWMVHLADQILQQQGRLTTATQDWKNKLKNGVICPTFE
jgi:predicted protein tyrosine phosphatase